MQLISPSVSFLPQVLQKMVENKPLYNLKELEHIEEKIELINSDPEKYIQSLTSYDKTLELNQDTLWMWDNDEYCGEVVFRYKNGSSELPDGSLGHIYYEVVPSKRNQGYASNSMKQILLLAKEKNMDFLELTIDAENTASQHVILNNNGYHVRDFFKASYFGQPKKRNSIYKIKI